MVSAKGLAALGITLTLTVACTVSSPAAPPQPAPVFPDVREEILQLLEKGALYRDRVDWPSAPKQLQGAKGTAEADRILGQLIARSTANHGRWIRASVKSQAPGARGVSRADQLQRQIAGKDASLQSTDSSDAADPIGWISSPRSWVTPWLHRRFDFSSAARSQVSYKPSCVPRMFVTVAGGSWTSGRTRAATCGRCWWV